MSFLFQNTNKRYPDKYRDGAYLYFEKQGNFESQKRRCFWPSLPAKHRLLIPKISYDKLVL